MPRPHLVPATTHDPGEPHRDAPPAPHQLHLGLDGLPAPVGEPDSNLELELPQLCPELKALFGQMDLLLDGLSPQETLGFARTCYRDGDNVLRARKLTAVR